MLIKIVKSRTARIALLALTVMAIVLGGFYLKRRVPDEGLIHRGHRIGRLAGQINYLEPAPEWYSDHEAIYLSYHQDGDRFEFNQLNADTGEQIPVDALNHIFAHQLLSNSSKLSPTNQVYHEPPTFAVAPGRERIVIAPSSMGLGTYDPIKTTYHVCDLSGADDILWKRGPAEDMFCPPIWLPDGKRWLTLTQGPFPPSVTVFDCDHPQLPGTRHPLIIPGHWLPQFATRNNLLWGYVFQNPPVGKPLAAVELNALAESSPVSHNITLPCAGYVFGTAHSPESDRVAWVMLYSYVSPASSLIHKVIKSARLQSTPMYGIWVSNPDGTNFREVGHEQMLHWTYNDGYIRWLPGGKKLAFHIGRDLYTIDVDR